MIILYMIFLLPLTLGAYHKAEYGQFCSDSGTRITSVATCKAAAATLGLEWGQSWWGPWDFPGCLHTKDPRNKVYFNLSPYATVDPSDPSVNPNYAEICTGEGKPEVMATINQFFRGYNIMLGDPINPSNPNVDPGFQEPIFKMSFKNDQTTPDGRYKQPDNTTITLCQGCSLSFKSTEISGTKAYQSSLDVLVSVDATFPFEDFVAKFSASTNYKHVEKETSSNHNLFTQSQASCCAYQIALESFTPPSFTDDFLTGIKSLTDDYNPSIYNYFISVFGTHYVKVANYGSLYGQQSMISREGWTTMESNEVDITASASASAIVTFASASTTTSTTKEEAETFKKHSINQISYSKGSKPPPDNKVSTWIEETKSRPSPASLQLMPIVYLLDDKSVFGLNVSKKVQENLKTAYKDYCNHLKNKSEVESCEAPGPDTGFPGYWQNWLTGIERGNRLNPKICDFSTYVTWMQFIFLKHMVKNYEYNIPTNLMFGCSNGKIYNSTGLHFHGSVPDQQNLTCNNDNGFEKINARVLENWQPVNFKIQCFDDTKGQFGINYFPKLQYCWIIPCNWKEVVACRKNQRMVGFQVQQIKDGYWKGAITDIRFQCATFN